MGYSAILENATGWARRAQSPACLAAKAYAKLYQRVYPTYTPVPTFKATAQDLILYAAELQKSYTSLTYSPERGDAIELVTDPDTLSLMHLSSGDLTTPAPECLGLIRSRFYQYDRTNRSFTFNPEAELTGVLRPSSDRVAQVLSNLVKEHERTALEYLQLDPAREYPTTITTPCWTCPNTACRDSLTRAVWPDKVAKVVGH